MTDDDRATIAENAIFRGQFDHWGSVTVRSGPVVECGVDDCDYLERHDIRWSLVSDRTPEAVGAFMFRLHLSAVHIGDVIDALEQDT